MRAWRVSQYCPRLREVHVQSKCLILSLPFSIPAAMPVLPFTLPNFTPFFAAKNAEASVGRSVGRSVGGLACERRGRRQLQTVVGGISPGANELGQRERKEREREREGESFKCSRDSRESNMVGESLAKNQS